MSGQAPEKTALPVPKEEAFGNPAAEVGQEFMVLRLGSEKGSLAGKYAGNAEGVARHLYNIDNPDYAISQWGPGTHLSVYGVKLTKETGEYDGHMEQGFTGDCVGRREDPALQGISYSFPQNGAGYESRVIARVPLSEIRARLPGPYASFEEAGTIEGAKAIRQSIADALERGRDGKISR